LHQNTLASSNPKLIKIPIHQNASHIYVEEEGGSEPQCGVRGGEAESSGGGFWCRAVAKGEEEAGIEAAVEETSVERHRRQQRRTA
jgi:hypothetical protein